MSLQTLDTAIINGQDILPYQGKDYMFLCKVRANSNEGITVEIVQTVVRF